MNHIAILPDLSYILGLKDRIDAFLHSFKEVVLFCKKAGIKHLSLFLINKSYKEDYISFHFLKSFINKISLDKDLSSCIFSFVGDWTELTGLQDEIKRLILREAKEGVKEDLNKEGDKEGDLNNLNKHNNGNTHIHFFVNYSSRKEIIDACRIIAERAVREKIEPDFVNTAAIEELMKMPGPDITLIIFFNTRSFNDFIGFKAWRAKFHYIAKSFIELKEKDLYEALKSAGLAKLL